MALVGHELSHFQVLEKLGEGGMGSVYKARDTRLDRSVAIKVLPPDKVADPGRRRRFAQEAKAASALSHPGIVTIYDIDCVDGVYFIAMEYVEGKTIDRLIGRKGLPLHVALGYAIQIADALACAHGAGIVHRDLKPANIMVTFEGAVKVLDFGLAKLVELTPLESDSTLTAGHTELPITEEGKIVGTFAYMSPEQAQGKPVDARSDVFSFGSVLFEMLTGRRAFAGETGVATLAAILNQDPAPLAAGPLPQDLERVVMRCLRKDPQRRWQTMADLRIALQDLKDESDSGKLSAAVAPRFARAGLKWTLSAAALALIVAAALAGWLLRKPVRTGGFETERLTFESGISGIAAISPDGKLMAYSSDREGPFNLYVQQIGGRQSIRLTNQETADWLPDFSPDGSKIVFRSERDGGGLYLIDTLGGPVQKIADRGWFARYSPDGSTIAYIDTPALVPTGKFYLIAAKGGTPRPFQPAFYAAPTGSVHSPPLWSPDGQSILFDGFREGDSKSRSWWIAPLAGGEPVRTTAPPLLPGSIMRYSFAWRGKHVYYSEGTTPGGMGIYRVPLAGPPWRVAGVPEQITPRLGSQSASISADGRMVFTASAVGVNVWSLPLKANQGTTFGERRRLTTDSNIKLWLSGAANGSKFAYMAGTTMDRPFEIRVRDNRSGHEDVITTSSSYLYLRPRLSADGTRLAWSDQVEGRVMSFLSGPGLGSSTPLCENCAVLDYFPDGVGTLVSQGRELARLNAATHERTALVDLTGLVLLDAAVAPDGRWLAFTVARPDGIAALFLAPAGQQVSPRDSWIQIAEDSRYLSRPAWSPDGKLIYYASTRDNFWCVWAQRIAGAGKLDGAPLATLHLHRFLESNFLGGVYFAVAPGNLYLLLTEVESNIWMVNVNR